MPAQVDTTCLSKCQWPSMSWSRSKNLQRAQLILVWCIRSPDHKMYQIFRWKAATGKMQLRSIWSSTRRHQSFTGSLTWQGREVQRTSLHATAHDCTSACGPRPLDSSALRMIGLEFQQTRLIFGSEPMLKPNCQHDDLTPETASKNAPLGAVPVEYPRVSSSCPQQKKLSNSRDDDS